MQQTSQGCHKQHMDLPDGFEIVRCAHGRIGQQNYAVVEARHETEQSFGVFCYSKVPSTDKYAMVTMHRYDRVNREYKDLLFSALYGCLEGGDIPIDYIIHANRNHIIGCDHGDESLQLCMLGGIAVPGLLLKGRPRKGEMWN